MPPLTGLLPSSLAAVLSQSLSLPLLFQLVTVAPYSRTSTESPVGRVAVTFPDSACTLGWGPVVEGEMADGRFGRSEMRPSVMEVSDSSRSSHTHVLFASYASEVEEAKEKTCATGVDVIRETIM